MISRYRWYGIRLPHGSIGLAEALLQHPLKHDDSYGFARSTLHPGNASIRFYWKTKVTITNFDDLGNAAYSNIVSINFYDFTILDIEGKLFLRIENPGRSSRELFNAIETIMGLGFVSEPVLFKTFDPVKVFQSIDSLKLIGLKVSDVVLSGDLVSRMEFSSKLGIDPNQLKALNGSKYKIDTGVYEITHEGSSGQLSISCNGLVKINGHLTPKLLHELEESLPSFR